MKRSVVVALAKAISCGMLLAAPLASTACGPSRTAEDAKVDLGSPDAAVRLKAAREIEGRAHAPQVLPPDVIDALLKQFPTESDPKTKASIITALGWTGDARVKPLLDPYMQTSDPDQQRWGARAYKKYVVATGQVAADYKFPDNYPYGTTGFPASVKK